MLTLKAKDFFLRVSKKFSSKCLITKDPISKCVITSCALVVQLKIQQNCMQKSFTQAILDSIEVSIPACHAGDPGSIPGRGEKIFLNFFFKVYTPKTLPTT